MNVKELFDTLDTLLKPRLQESFDNTGTQILCGQSNITGILFTLDINEDILQEAVSKNCSVIIAHHPFLFKSIKKIDNSDPSSAMIHFAIKNDISIYAAHTNIDKRYFDTLAQTIGFQNTEVLVPTNPMENESLGFGSIARGVSYNLKDLLTLIKSQLNIEALRYCGSLEKKITSIAMINGSGTSFLEKILHDDTIDCLITGDVGYHAFHRANLYGFPIIDAGHYGTEKHLLDFLYKEVHNYLTKEPIFKEIQLYKSTVEKDPIKFF